MDKKVISELFPEFKAELKEENEVITVAQQIIQVGEAEKQTIDESLRTLENMNDEPWISELIQNLGAVWDEHDKIIAEAERTIKVTRARKKAIIGQLKALGITSVAPNRDALYNGTLSCQELEMPLDGSGHVKGWMEGEPINDDWDGLNDNQLRILEDMEPERRAKHLSEL